MRRSFLFAASLFLGACSPSVATITLEPGAVLLTSKGESKVIQALPKKESGEVNAEAVAKLKWTSSNPDVATVLNGTVTAVKSGDAVVTAEIGDVKAVARVRVSIPVSIAIQPRGLEIVGLGKSGALKAVVKDDAGRDAAEPQIVWNTSTATIATVAGGKVDAVAIGKAQITATLGTLVATATISVRHPDVAKIELVPGQRELEKVGDAVRLVAILTDAKGEPIRGLAPAWTSSDEKIATVSAEGLVTAVKKGKVKVTAAAQSQSVEVEISVLGAK